MTLLNVYGPSETTIVATSHVVGDREEGPIPVGSALPDYELHVLDERPRRSPRASRESSGSPGRASAADT